MAPLTVCMMLYVRMMERVENEYVPRTGRGDFIPRRPPHLALFATFLQRRYHVDM